MFEFASTGFRHLAQSTCFQNFRWLLASLGMRLSGGFLYPNLAKGDALLTLKEIHLEMRDATIALPVVKIPTSSFAFSLTGHSLIYYLTLSLNSWV